MISHSAQMAWGQVAWILGLWFGASLLAGLVWAAVDSAAKRRASRARLAAMPALSPEALDAGCKRLLSAIPAQRTGGGRR